MDYLEDITGSDHLEPEWGEHFRSWYVTKTFERKENFSLPYEQSIELDVFNFQYRFIMPAKIEFSRGLDGDGKIMYGIISYSEAERLLGVFRFPLDDKGFFSTPISANDTANFIKNFSDDELRDLISRKKVLTFEAFRTPFFGFEFFNIMGSKFEAVEKIVGSTFTNSLRRSYDSEMAIRIEDVKSKIKVLPNYLLILQNVLDLRWRDEKEISTMTNGIIHFGA
jgi:hypothetical protein